MAQEVVVPSGDDLAALWSLTTTPQASVTLDTGRFLASNPAWQPRFGWAPGSLQTRTWLELVRPEDRGEVRRCLEQLQVAAAAPQSCTAVVLGPHGSHHPARWTAARATDGTHALLIAESPDAASWQQERRDLEQRFRLAMYHAPVGMAISRLDGPWVAVNPALCALFGRSEAELLGGLSFADLTHPDDLAAELPLLDELLAGDRGHYALEKRYRHTDGSEVWTQTVVTLVRDDDGAPRYFVAQCLDLTDRLRMEAELRATNERLLQSDGVRLAFLRATSHELRTPLTVVSGLAETLSRVWRELPAAKVDDLLGRMVANTIRLRTLVEDLLDVDRLTSGVITAQRREAPVDALVRDALASLELNGRELRTELHPVTASVDVPKLERVVVNLVANAVRHSPPDGCIWVRCRGDHQAVTIHVEDEGPGIPDGFEESIFEPFVQAPPQWRDANPGAGLGLTLAREFVQLHGGSLRAVNRAPAGASFEVVLPHCTPNPGEGRG